MSELDTQIAPPTTAKGSVYVSGSAKAGTTPDTEYVLLARDDVDKEAWTVQAHLKARSGEAAIRSYLDGSASNGTYVAVPARSWRPVTVKAEQTTTLKLENAT